MAAPTTSLPEHFGSDRNWDYRFCWLRDAALTLESLLSVGYREEAESWQEWLLQAVGSDVRGLQIMYGMRGERHLPECELPWLQGYRKSKPVGMGNAASEQVQLDVYGEVADATVSMKRAGMHCDPRLFRMQRNLTNHVASIRHRPAAGIWERRGPQKHYIYSKAMAWLALHHGVEELQGAKVPSWRIARDQLHRQICHRGFNRKLRSFVQSFDSDVLDASVLLLPIFGFLPFTDERITSTIDVVQRKLGRDGFIYRLSPTSKKDREFAFLACSFWMVENLAGVGRRGEAEKLLERTISCKNDVGLLSEEYNPTRGRLMGNFPQALCPTLHLLTGAVRSRSHKGCVPYQARGER